MCSKVNSISRFEIILENRIDIGLISSIDLLYIKINIYVSKIIKKEGEREKKLFQAIYELTKRFAK